MMTIGVITNYLPCNERVSVCVGSRFSALPKTDCPWDSLLEYRSPQLEENYLQTQHQSWCIADFWFYTMMLLGSVSWVLLQSGNAQPLTRSDNIGSLPPSQSITLFNCWAAVSILGTLTLVWSSTWQKGPYRAYKVIFYLLVFFKA